ncbi:MAG: hypothetical protein ACLTSX_06535 [Collinsella sp.]
MNARGCELYGRWSEELGFAFQALRAPWSSASATGTSRTLEHLRDNGLSTTASRA